MNWICEWCVRNDETMRAGLPDQCCIMECSIHGRAWHWWGERGIVPAAAVQADGTAIVKPPRNNASELFEMQRQVNLANNRYAHWKARAEDAEEKLKKLEKGNDA